MGVEIELMLVIALVQSGFFWFLQQSETGVQEVGVVSMQVSEPPEFRNFALGLCPHSRRSCGSTGHELLDWAVNFAVFVYHLCCVLDR